MDCMSGNNVFVSYKYLDRDVKPLNNNYDTIARDYVNFMEKEFKTSKKVYYRGEKDDHDLSHYSEETLRQYLSNMIFYTS